MPRGNGTGPKGNGPMTGRGAGFCSGYGTAGYMNAGGREARCARGGFGGGGFGWRNRYFETGLPGRVRSGRFGEPYPERNSELEKQFLKARMESLQTELEMVKKRLAEDDKRGSEE